MWTAIMADAGKGRFMAIVEIARNQQIQIPAIRLTNGEPFGGNVKASDGETIVLELSGREGGRIPPRVDEMCVLVWEAEGIQRSCPFIVRSHSGHEIVGQIVVQERREAPRMRIDLTLVYEVIPAQRVREVADEVMARVHSLEETESETVKMLRGTDDPVEQLRAEVLSLRECVGQMMGKIDELAAVIGGDAPAAEIGGMRRPLTVINCSSTGLGFISSAGHPPGEYLRLRMQLQTSPQTVIECVGSVIRCERLAGRAEEGGGERFDIGLRFTHIHEADRERLIHYLFKVQRRLLRDRREARDAMSATQ